MKTSIKQSQNFIFDRLFASMTLEEKKSFSKDQIKILHRAAAKLQPRKHALDLRISIPLPFRKDIYCVFLAGPEKRSDTRIYQERKRFWRLVIPAIASLAIVLIVALGLPGFLQSTHPLKNATAHPTALPWIKLEQECLGENYFWEEGACWDKQHSESF